ncbi:IS110 family transposase [Rubrivirga sp.]|uniref:IS110 family transposase n=1 Tax=Rubrivirga sp. TaxID=1885344 RepID=UPI003B515EA9
MDTPQFYVGIDVASETLAVALTRGPGQTAAKPLAVANDPDGFAALAAWLAEHAVAPDQARVCLESTGVYGEALCYWLHDRGFRVVVEDAARVRRAMPVAGAKTDALDAARIADYAARFLDELRPWAPADAVVEQVQTLLTTREQLTRERTAKLNARRMLARKAVQTPLAIRIADDAVDYLKARIIEIDREVKRLVSSHPTIGPAVALLVSVPGVGHLLASHLCVATGGFSRPLRPEQASAWLGICPLDFESGSSVRRKPRSRGDGPSAIRKPLYLASMRPVSIDGSPHPAYSRRKTAEGKSGRLVLNNVSNKLLRVAAAVLRDGEPYEGGHVSTRPTI